MSLRFVIVALAAGAGFSFLLGRMARVYLLQQQQRIQELQTSNATNPSTKTHIHPSLPSPLLGASHHVPTSTEYTSKQFYPKGRASESFLIRYPSSTLSTNQISHSSQEASTSHHSKADNRQYLATDISRIRKRSLQKYLDSETGVALLLNELVAKSQDVFLSYHCQTIARHQHISCTGIAPHGHVVIHVLPDRLSLDVFGITLNAEAVNRIFSTSLVALQAPPATASLSVPTSASSAAKRNSQAQKLANGAFVHPAMLAHEFPRNVLLLGGSSTTVKNILRYSTVERLLLVDMDPKWNGDCNVLEEGSSFHYCADYPRVELYQEPALEWFANTSQAVYDSIDAVFIEQWSWSADKVWVVDYITDLMSEEGIVVIQSPAKTQEDRKVKYDWVEGFVAQGREYENIREYSEGDSTFLIAFVEDKVSLGRWFGNEAEVNLAIRERVVVPLDYMDGTTMQRYRYPSRNAEDDFCLDHPDDATCKEGHGLDPQRYLIPMSSFEVKPSTIPNAGRGVFMKHAAEAGSYVFLDDCVHGMHLTDSTIRLVEDIAEGDYNDIPVGFWETIMWYADGYGYTAEDYGKRAYDVDAGIGTFVNHGCNGTTSVGAANSLHLSEETFTILQSVGSAPSLKFNPAFDRTLRSHGCAENIALRDLHEGEEIFNNYMTFEASDSLEEFATSLRAECSGRSVGQVSQYEMSISRGEAFPGLHHLLGFLGEANASTSADQVILSIGNATDQRSGIVQVAS